MIEVTPEEMDYSIEKIREMKQWPGFNGFTAESCGSCKATANVLAGGPGWFCPCGHFNVQSWSGFQIPHRAPTYGPGQAKILEAYHDV
jgi:hypothetical protein